MPRRPLPAVLVGALVPILILTGCASGPATEADSSVESQDRGLVVYSGRDEELIAPLVERFEEESGIDVEVRYAGSTELAAQLIEEGAASPAQVFLSQDSGALGAVASAGLLEQLPTSITDTVSADYTSRDGSWVGLTGRARVVAYDSERYSAEQIPADVTLLTAPEWNGEVGIVPGNASFQAFITALRLDQGEDAARAFLDGLVANDAQIYERNGELLEAVNAGTVGLGLINHYYWARSEQDPTTLRAQLRFGAPGTVSALVNVTGAGVLAAGTSAEATEFVEWLVGDEAQRYFLEETYEYPLAIDGSPAGVPVLADLGAPDVDLARLDDIDATVDMITAAGLL